MNQTKKKFTKKFDNFINEIRLKSILSYIYGWLPNLPPPQNAKFAPPQIFSYYIFHEIEKSKSVKWFFFVFFFSFQCTFCRVFSIYFSPSKSAFSIFYCLVRGFHKIFTCLGRFWGCGADASCLRPKIAPNKRKYGDNP